ncbi:endonuclease VII [Escherichia phage vB_EcoS_ESCO41]|uniref:HNH endonuclease n=1 Tax=Escherichia phage vB_EcoS_ESCO41 TaxID=2496547 RepID=A0A1U9WR12_9CAUD|nr:endonuclease VII [Escherichia phage vB_EcoS_ESCO41]AQY55293.1 hypothetical protein ESCO41_00066 [Escherichia phage vB_EcoS_ESCO41]
MFRVCKKCGVEKPFELFCKHKQCKNGITHECKECSEARRVPLDPKEKADYDKRRYERSRDSHLKMMSENNELYKMRHYIASDKKKGFVSDINIEYCIIKMNEPCHYCGHIDTPANGLDRIDNSIGHVKSNLVPCCRLCNMTRGDRWSHEDFIKYISPSIKLFRREENVS